MPRCTYGPSTSGVPLGPTVPTTAPSATAALRATAIEPRCVSVTERPSGVSIVTDLPLVGTVPAKLTTPDAGASTGAPARSADVDAAVLAAGVRVRAVEGEALQHRPADGPRPRGRGRRNPEHEQQDEQNDPAHSVTASVVRIVNEAGTLAAASAVVKTDYSEPR